MTASVAAYGVMVTEVVSVTCGRGRGASITVRVVDFVHILSLALATFPQSLFESSCNETIVPLIIGVPLLRREL